ncbi:unnamed protein product, partial [Choristocarpus tenellus]
WELALSPCCKSQVGIDFCVQGRGNRLQRSWQCATEREFKPPSLPLQTLSSNSCQAVLPLWLLSFHSPSRLRFRCVTGVGFFKGYRANLNVNETVKGVGTNDERPLLTPCLGMLAFH